MPHEDLQGSGVDTATGKRVPGAVMQHVHMDRERKLGSLAKPLDQLLRPVDRHRRLALAQEQIARVLAIGPDHGADEPQFVTLEAMDGLSTLTSAR